MNVHCETHVVEVLVCCAVLGGLKDLCATFDDADDMLKKFATHAG